MRPSPLIYQKIWQYLSEKEKKKNGHGENDDYIDIDIINVDFSLPRDTSKKSGVEVESSRKMRLCKIEEKSPLSNSQKEDIFLFTEALPKCSQTYRIHQNIA